MQIRARLTLQFLMIVTAILLPAFFIIKFQFRENLDQEYFKRLRWNAYIVSELVIRDMSSDEEIDVQFPLKLTGPLVGYYPENVSIYTMEGKKIYMFDEDFSPLSMAVVQEVIAKGEHGFTRGKFMAFGIVYKNNAGNSYVVIVESFFDRVYMDNLTQILSVVFLISMAIVGVGGWLFARQALAPVSRIMNQVDALLPTDISQRLKPTNQYDELSRLVITFNKLLDRIQQVFRIQKMFLSNVSHELKNPLNVITSQIEVTLDKERTNQDYRSTLESILYDVKELNAIGDRLMQLARVNAEDSNIQFKLLRIDEVIWEAKETLMTNHPEYKINFEVVNLPANELHLFIKGNEQLLKTALINLMDNGCKFSPDKNVKVKLAFSPEGATTIEVSDKGPGISEVELPMVFNAFYRSAKTSTIRGSGIGLSLVESILKLHNIKLEVHSKEGEGSTFIMSFPVIEIET